MIFKFQTEAFFISLIYLVYFTSLMKGINGCSNFCKNNSTCVGRAGEPMSLVCEDMMIWFKSPNLKLGTSTLDIVDKENYSINNCVVSSVPVSVSTSTRPRRQQVLTIKSLSAKDTGYNTYKAKIDYEEDDNFCYYNIFVYDLEKFSAKLTINGQSRDLNSTEPWNVEIVSFNDRVEYDFKIETLPLDSLTVNDQIINSTGCVKLDNPQLKCLQSNKTELSLSKCVANYTITFGYNLNYLDEFKSQNIHLAAKNFTHFINLIYPPQVKNEKIELSYKPSDTQVTLNCEVECANPSDIEYIWIAKNDTVLYRSTISNIYIHEIPNDFNEDFEIYCLVNNSVQNGEISRESRTKYIIRFNNDSATTINPDISSSTVPTILSNATTVDYFNTTFVFKSSSGELEGWEIALIVIGTVGFFAIVGFVFFYLFWYRKRQTGVITERDFAQINRANYSSTDNVEFDGNSINSNIRQQQLTDELNDNPVYGYNPGRGNALQQRSGNNLRTVINTDTIRTSL